MDGEKEHHRWTQMGRMNTDGTEGHRGQRWTWSGWDNELRGIPWIK